jgi:hypothetical protein
MRFQNLLAFGITGDVLMQFFRENRAALLSAAVKVDNLPPNPASARRVVAGFNAKAHKIFGKWIAQHLSDTAGPTPDEIITRFRSAEVSGVALDTQEREELDKSGLRELYLEKPDSKWIEFLRTPIVTEAAKSSSVCAADWIALTSWWLGSGPRPSDNSPILAAVADLREAVDRRDPELLKDAPTFDGAAEEIRSAINKISNADSNPPVQRGIIASGPVERIYDPKTDYTQFAVIATNRSPRVTEPFFIVAEAFVDDDGEVFSLAPAELRQAIPSDARIVLHKDRGFPVAPAIGEAFVYGVEKFKTEMPVKVKGVEAIPDRLFRVVHIPVTSKEAHKIRDHIVEYARTLGARGAIFVTLDKVCLHPRAESIQRVLANDFDWQLERWDSLQAVELMNGAYAIALLPPTTKGLDCSPLSRGARRLLKAFSQRSEIKMQKAQRDALQDLIGSDQLGFDDSTRERLLTNIDAIDRGSQDFEFLIEELMQSNAIKEDIEKRVNEKVEALALARAKETQSLDSLKREKENIERRIERLRDDADKKAKAVRSAIQKAFANTSAKELETLGQVAVFEALIARDTESWHGTLGGDAAGGNANLVWDSPILPSKLSIEEVLRALGIKGEVAQRAEGALLMAVNLGLPLVCSGVGASHVSTQLAASMCSESCLVADIPLGLAHAIDFANILSARRADSLLLRNGNLSDMSIYAPSLLSLVFQRALDKREDDKRSVVVIGSATGPAALPLPEEITQLAVNVSLATLEIRLGSDAQTPLEIIGNPLWRRLSLKAEALENSQPNAHSVFADLRRLASGAIDAEH